LEGGCRHNWRKEFRAGIFVWNSGGFSFLGVGVEIPQQGKLPKGGEEAFSQKRFIGKEAVFFKKLGYS